MDRQGLEQVIWTGRQGPFFLWLGVRDRAEWMRAWQGQVTPQTPERALYYLRLVPCVCSVLIETNGRGRRPTKKVQSSPLHPHALSPP